MPAKFIFDSEAGTISAWTPTDPIQHQRPHQAGGAGRDLQGAGDRVLPPPAGLYAADFGHSRVGVFDSRFHVVNTARGVHGPHAAERLRAVRHPEHRRRVVVSYAKHEPGASDEIDGPGLGFVDVYTQNGRWSHRLASHGALNAPWGLVRAPAGFGRFSGALLVGNFGDGRINAYDPNTGQWLGTLRRPNGDPIAIDGLWGLRFGNGVTGGPNDLLFSAGIRRRGARAAGHDPARELDGGCWWWGRGPPTPPPATAGLALRRAPLHLGEGFPQVPAPHASAPEMVDRGGDPTLGAASELPPQSHLDGAAPIARRNLELPGTAGR